MSDQADNLRQLVEQVTPQVTPHHARRIVFLSGKGGVGKTSIAVNMALALARLGKRTILIDCDIGLANADIILGINPKITLDGIITTGQDVRSALIKLPSGLWLLPGAAGIIPRQALNHGRLEAVLNKLDNSADFIIMDGGAGIDEGVQYLAALSDEAVIVAAPESASAVNAYRLIKIILKRSPAPSIRLLINRAGNDRAARRVAVGLMGAMSEFLTDQADYLGWVPKDTIVEQAGRERRPFVEKYPGSLPARSVVALAHRLIQPPPGPNRAA